MPGTSGSPWDLPFHLLSDLADGPDMIKDLADKLSDNTTGVLGQAWPCTVATRPGHKAGRLIHETDTGRILLSSGASWRVVYPTPIHRALAAPGTVMSGSTNNYDFPAVVLGDAAPGGIGSYRQWMVDFFVTVLFNGPSEQTMDTYYHVAETIGGVVGAFTNKSWRQITLRTPISSNGTPRFTVWGKAFFSTASNVTAITPRFATGVGSGSVTVTLEHAGYTIQPQAEWAA